MKAFNTPEAADPAPWSFMGELPAGVPARFAVPDPEHEQGRRLFDCDLLAAMCAAYLGTGFRPAAT
jgi:hypothetical protein